ncbi:MAG: HAD family hydrolase [Bacteroidales bacterium]|nr:HAD family hydrolase [Bacteroidales bacterium]
MTKGLLFDYGGTIDTNGQHWAEVLWSGYCEMQIPVSKEQFREAYIYGERALASRPLIKPEHNFRDVLEIKCRLQAEYLFDNKLLSESLFVEKISNEVATICYQFAKRTTQKAATTLSELSKKYPMVLVSNFYGNIENVLRDFGLLHFFPVIIESAVVGVRKPNPEIFRLGVDALGFLPEECMVIGDSVSKDIIPAQSIGCQTIWLTGKGWDDTEKENQATKKCVAIIENFGDLIKYLG